MATKKGRKESVTLREKKLANGNISLYLDIYRDGKRSYEFLKLYITKATTPLEREVNRQTRATAQAIKAKRQIELQNNEY
ncbi:Arm DNA-binding domain-containing protein, partial [Lascolabacillus sp.]|uniref:Arm DNA-binding domain-containing protein n=1 Tax=Lascolabacillus sp. TaxID=1924068 RepID=UPI00258A7254